MRVIYLKVAVAGFALLNVFAFVYISQPPGPFTVTLGTLADKGKDFSRKRLIIENSVGGVKKGRFLVFETPAPDRYPVVFELNDPDEEGTVFSGYCYGLRLEPLEGCPLKPPFIYVSFVTSP